MIGVASVTNEHGGSAPHLFRQTRGLHARAALKAAQGTRRTGNAVREPEVDKGSGNRLIQRERCVGRDGRGWVWGREEDQHSVDASRFVPSQQH